MPDIKAIAARIYQDVLRNQNPSALDELIDPGIVDHDAIAQGWGSGRSGFRRHVAHLHEVFSDIHVTVEHVFAEDEKVVAIWKLSGIQSGAIFGVAPTGRRIEGRTLSVLQFAEGRLVEYQSYDDQLGILLQLGDLGKYAPQFQAAGGATATH
jgi:predicted ester cyclase